MNKTVNDNLKKTNPCIGVGVKTWGIGPRPVLLSGEPSSFFKEDIGYEDNEREVFKAREYPDWKG